MNPNRISSPLCWVCAGWLTAAAALAALPTWPALAAERPQISQTLAEVEHIAALREHVQDQDHGAAAALAESYLEGYPEGSYRDEALLALGRALAAQGEHESAEGAYGRLIGEHEGSPFREYALAGSYLTLRESSGEDAAERLEALLEEYPRGLLHNRATFWKGRELDEAGELEGAVAHLSRVDRSGLRDEGERADYDRLLGMAYVAQGRRAEAEPLLQSYLTQPDAAAQRAPVLMFLADEALQARRWKAAREYYEELVEVSPHPPLLAKARYWRADLHARIVLDPAPPEEQEAVRTESIALYSAYLESGDEAYADRALRRRARLLADAGQDEAALEDYDRLFERDAAFRNEPAIVTARADLLRRLGRPEEAAALLSQAGQNPEIGQEARKGLLIEEVRVYYDGEDCAKVLRLLRPLPPFETSDRIDQAMFMRGFCHYREGQWEEASSDLEHLVKFPRFQPLVWKPLVESYDRSGQYSRLVRFLQEQTETGRIEPTAQTAHLLARGYEHLNKPSLVVAIYTDLEAREPEALNSPEALHRLAKAEEELDDTEGAIAHYEAVLNLQEPGEPPHDRYRESLARLENLLGRMGRWELLVQRNQDAESVLTEPADREPLRAARRKAYIGWGRADSAEGRHEEAAGRYLAAWELTPLDDRTVRVETLAMLAEAYGRAGKHDTAVSHYQAEMERTADMEYRLLLSLGLAGLYQGWAEAVEREQGIAEAVPLYEVALRHVPEQQWEQRYRIIVKLDPVYQQQNEFGKLIVYLEAMERAVTDGAFRADLRRYRMSLYRTWGMRAAEAGQNADAERHFSNAIGLLLGERDWSGLSELSAARALLLNDDEQFERQLTLLRDAAPRAPDNSAANEARLSLLSTEFEWARSRERQDDTEGALAHYAQAEEQLTEADWRWRREIALSVGGIHRGRGDYAKEIEVLQAAIPAAPDAEAQAGMRRAVSRAHEHWAERLLEGKKTDAALEHYRLALAELPAERWEERFRIAQPLGRIYLEREDSRALAGLYEGIYPDIPEAGLKAQIDLFLGQIYAKWADYANRAKKYEFARQRYHKALRYLPNDQWELRIAVAKQLEALYDREEDVAGVTAVYGELVPSLDDVTLRRSYALYLGRLYWDKAKDAEQARQWLISLETGGDDPVSLEAGFILAEIALANDNSSGAQVALEDLVQRNLNGSAWYVPVHYQLAVLHHEADRLDQALEHYRLVAGVKSKEARKLYPKSIAHSKQQVREIEAYLRVRGGDAGREIDAPGFQRKPPVPGRKNF